MVFSFQEHTHKDPSFGTDNFDDYGLLCEEGGLGECCGFDDGGEIINGEEENQENVVKTLTLLENDVFWEDDEVVRLFCKEKEGYSFLVNDFGDGDLDPDGSLVVEVRKEAVEWILKVVKHYGFSTLTAVLAVRYYDEFVLSICFQKDKPLTSQLAAVACLSIAAKMEEIQVPLLLDLQVENCKFVFEAKTIMRMELLVLSALKWKTSIVTPISFIDHIGRRFGLIMNNFHWDFFKRCESILLGIIADFKLLRYPSSVLATATMLFVLNEIDPCGVMNHQNQLLNVLKVDKGNVNECYRIIVDHQYEMRKRKYISTPGSPSCVIDSNISCDSSNDSWSVASSVSSSPERMCKRSRAQDQSMSLSPTSSASMAIGYTIH